MEKFRPEGCLYNTPENQKYISTEENLNEAISNKYLLEARAIVCDSNHNLIVDLPCMKGIIPREEGALGIAEGATRDIALISRVNKPVRFIPLRIETDMYGHKVAILSRKEAQEQCRNEYVSKLKAGNIIEARVTHLEQFGCFVDIGCGIPSLIPIDTISVSRISHPSDRFTAGQIIKAIVKSNCDGRICLTHKELLGTWEENASQFEVGETVSGIVRSVEDYGVFIELTPNLAGLAELRPDIKVGESVSVYIKAIIPEKMKIKLIVVDVCEKLQTTEKMKYFSNDTHIDKWIYTPDSASKVIETVFE
ncbi:MAG: 30S ribosomal protein S1 [Ruminococcus sp.]|nr:30S ribosomal protein S1 [Ruminococcus sp.]